MSLREMTSSVLLLGLSACLFCGLPALADRPVRVTSNASFLTDSPSMETGLADRSLLTSVVLQACPGEAEPFSVVIENTSNDAVTVLPSISDFVASESVIPLANVDIKYILWWYQASGAWNSHRRARGKGKGPVLVPELVANDPTLVRTLSEDAVNHLKIGGADSTRYRDISIRSIATNQDVLDTNYYEIFDAPALMPVSIGAHEAQQILVDIEIPKSTPAGNYSAVLSLQIDGREKEVLVPVSLRVLPFALKGPALEFSIYYRGKLSPGNPTTSSEYKDEKQLVADLLDIKALGISNPVTYQRSRPKGLLGPRSREQAKARLRRVLGIRRNLDLVAPNFYYLGRLIGFPNTKKHFRHLGEEISELQDMVQEYGFERLYLYGKDEAKGERLASQRETWEFVRSRGAKVFVAGSAGHTEAMGGLTDLLIQHGPPSETEADYVHTFKNRIFSYSNPQIGTENAALFRRNYGFNLWRVGFDGAMPYAYQHAMGDPWNDFDHKIYRDLMLAYPSADKPIRTLAWYGLREAIDDTRYLAILLDHLDAESESQGSQEELMRVKTEVLRGPGDRPVETRSMIIDVLAPRPSF